jgi:hypothetical protein
VSQVLADVIEGSTNTHELALISRNDSKTRAFAVYCAKLGQPVTLADARASLHGIVEIDFK